MPGDKDNHHIPQELMPQKTVWIKMRDFRLTLLLIWEVLGLNFSSETGYSD